MSAELLSAGGLREARSLLEASGLLFETDFDDMAGVYENGRLIACGARSGGVLKMLAIDADYQGGALLGEIVTLLVSRAERAGFASVFIFTKPEYASTFQALNFTLLANQGKAALLEYGRGLSLWLKSHENLRTIGDGRCGAAVMNCNPFTRGHRYLIERAAREVDRLYLFVVREDRSVFPFEVRMSLVREGVADLANVAVLDTSRYIVSAATFPTYFLKEDDPAARIQMELDALLFATRIAPFFKVTRRFVGTEPRCALTGGYNEAMKRILPAYGIELVEIERLSTDSGAISASRVRELIAAGDFSALVDYVPARTLAFLESAAAAPIRQRLQNDFHSQ